MMYPQKRPQRTQKAATKPVNIANLINEKLQQRQKDKQRQKNNQNSPKQPSPFLKKNHLTITPSILSLTLHHHQHATTSLREYVQILQQKQQQHQSQILFFKRKLNQLQSKDQFDNIMKQSYYYGLQEYYVKSRKIMVDVCYELVDCKSVLMSYSESGKFRGRVEGITGVLGRVEVFMKSNSLDVNVKNDSKQQEKSTLNQLKAIIQIQQKSIKHLKQLSKHPSIQPFQQQKRLLRYQINRLFLQNQKLQQNINQTYSQFLSRLHNKDFENERILLNQTVREYFDLMNSQVKMKDVEYKCKVEKEFMMNRLEEEKEQMRRVEREREGVEREKVRGESQRRVLEEEIRVVSQQNLDFKIQLRRLGQVEKEWKQYKQQLRYIKNENSKLISQITKLTQQNKSLKLQLTTSLSPPPHPFSSHHQSLRQTQLQSQLNDLKQKLIVTQVLLQQSNSRLRFTKQQLQQQQQSIHIISQTLKTSQQNLNSMKSFEHTLEEKIMFLEEYLRESSEEYYLIWREWKRRQQEMVMESKQMVKKLAEEKDMIMGWCKRVYILLKQSDIPGETIQKHLQQLQDMSKTSKRKQKGPKIQRLLQQVKDLNNRLDRHQQRQIEQELQQYILTLNKRADVIQEVLNEDGSSVAALTEFRSEAFTDYDERENDL